MVNHRRYGGKRYFLAAPWVATYGVEEGIAHVHAQFGWAAQPAMLVAHLSGASFSFTLHHSDIYMRPPRNLDELVDHALFCVTVSDFNRSYLLREWPTLEASKVHVIRCGVDTEKFRPNRARHRPDRVARLLCVARLEPVKNIPFILEICASLRRRGIGCRCTIVGDGSERADLERRVEQLGLGHCVLLAGRVPQEKLVYIYQDSDIFVLASESEGLPVVAMEAMATGLPVVAPRIMGIPELVEDGVTGLLYQRHDLEAACAAVQRLVEDPGLGMRMGARGRRRVVSAYNWLGNAHTLAGLFAEATSGCIQRTGIEVQPMRSG
jgi:glycosyltransferase involved in cell wall biosynthesis